MSCRTPSIHRQIWYLTKLKEKRASTIISLGGSFDYLECGLIINLLLRGLLIEYLIEAERLLCHGGVLRVLTAMRVPECHLLERPVELEDGTAPVLELLPEEGPTSYDDFNALCCH